MLGVVFWAEALGEATDIGRCGGHGFWTGDGYARVEGMLLSVSSKIRFCAKRESDLIVWRFS